MTLLHQDNNGLRLNELVQIFPLFRFIFVLAYLYKKRHSRKLKKYCFSYMESFYRDLRPYSKDIRNVSK